MPKTQFGKYACGLMLIAIALYFFTWQIIINLFGQRGGDTILDNLWISVPMLSAGIAAVASFITGTISLIRDKERAILVFVCSFLGLLVTLFIGGELLFPH